MRGAKKRANRFVFIIILVWFVWGITSVFAITIIEKNKNYKSPQIPEKWKVTTIKNSEAFVTVGSIIGSELSPALTPGGTLLITIDSSHKAVIRVSQGNTLIVSEKLTEPIEKIVNGRFVPNFKSKITFKLKIPLSVAPENGDLLVDIDWSRTRFKETGEGTDPLEPNVKIYYYSPDGEISGIERWKVPIVHSKEIKELNLKLSTVEQIWAKVRFWLWIAVIISVLIYFGIFTVAPIAPDITKSCLLLLPVYITGIILSTAIFVTIEMGSIKVGGYVRDGIPWFSSFFMGVLPGIIVFGILPLLPYYARKTEVSQEEWGSKSKTVSYS